MATAKPLTQAQIIDKLATANDLPKAKIKEILSSLTDLAYKEAKQGFTVPGLGKITLVKRKARMGRNPQTGEAIKIPAKKVVKFRVAKAAKDSILGTAPAKPAAKKAVKKTAKKVAKKTAKKVVKKVAKKKVAKKK